jgi:hypothetical protein
MLLNAVIFWLMMYRNVYLFGSLYSETLLHKANNKLGQSVFNQYIAYIKALALTTWLVLLLQLPKLPQHQIKFF